MDRSKESSMCFVGHSTLAVNKLLTCKGAYMLAIQIGNVSSIHFKDVLRLELIVVRP